MGLRMNNLRQEIDGQDRKYATLAKLLKVTRGGLAYKIDNDVFADDERAIASGWLNKPVAELFPEPDAITQEVPQP